MPELPEVETSRRGIEPHLVGATILHARGAQRALALASIRRDLPSERQTGAERAAHAPNTCCWSCLMAGLSFIWGCLAACASFREELPAEKHDHVDLVMSNGKVLRYTDPRRFGAWLWTKELDGHNVLAHLGPEPLSDDFNADYLQQKCAKKKTAIKPWLMDNKLVVGVGNIYASESLFAAGIHPDRLASSLSHGRSANC